MRSDITLADFTGPTTDAGGGQYEQYIGPFAPTHDPFTDYPPVLSPPRFPPTIDFSALPMSATSYSLAHNLAARRQKVWDCWGTGVVVGWIGDTAHQAECSDHNPDSTGMVHAIDPMVTGTRAQAVVDEALAHDGDLQYIIHNRVIWSRTVGFAARTYTGSDPHTDHVHLSGKHGSSHSTSHTCTGYDLAAQAVNPTFNICSGGNDMAALDQTDLDNIVEREATDWNNTKSGMAIGYRARAAEANAGLAAAIKAVQDDVAALKAATAPTITQEQLDLAMLNALKTLAGGQA